MCVGRFMDGTPALTYRHQDSRSKSPLLPGLARDVKKETIIYNRIKFRVGHYHQLYNSRVAWRAVPFFAFRHFSSYLLCLPS